MNMILRFYNMLMSDFGRLNYRRFWQALNKGQSAEYYFDQGQPWNPMRKERFEDYDYAEDYDYDDE